MDLQAQEMFLRVVFKNAAVGNFLSNAGQVIVPLEGRSRVVGAMSIVVVETLALVVVAARCGSGIVSLRSLIIRALGDRRFVVVLGFLVSGRIVGLHLGVFGWLGHRSFRGGLGSISNLGDSYGDDLDVKLNLDGTLLVIDQGRSDAANGQSSDEKS